MHKFGSKLEPLLVLKLWSLWWAALDTISHCFKKIFYRFFGHFFKYVITTNIGITVRAENASHHQTLSKRLRCKHMGEILCIGVHCQITWRPSLLPTPLIHWLNYWFLLVYCSRYNIVFQLCKSLFEDRREASTFLCGPRIWFACSHKSIGVWTRSFWNNIGECYTVVLM